MSQNKIQVPSRTLNPVSLAETYEFLNETPAIVKDYFNTVGIIDDLSEDDFEQRLFQHYGCDATHYLETVASDNRTWCKRAVSARSGNPGLALAVCSQLDGTRYEAYFSWLAKADLPQPTRVLDVWCGIGVTTCFYATLFPEATITAIDNSSEAVECAKKLAAKLGLENIEFIQADIRRLRDELKGQKFDLVFATRVAESLSDDSRDYGDTVEDVLAYERPAESSYHKAPCAKPLADLLADEKAMLISFEDALSPHDLAEWLRSLRDAGICVSKNNVDLVYYFDTEYACCGELLLLAGSKQAAELPTAEEIRSLWTGGLDEIPEQNVYQDVEAESVLVATEPKELCHSIVNASFGNDAFSFTELWASGSHVLIYKYDFFARKLVRLPAEDPKRLIELLVEAFDDREEDDNEDDA